MSVARPRAVPSLVLFAALCAGLLGACGSHTADAQTMTPRAPPAAPGAAPAATGTAGPVDPCVDIQRRFAAAVAAAPGRCTAASECGCYNPVAPGLACGGVTDRATNAVLARIEAEFHAASCRWPLQCGAWVCAPRCTAGRCTR